MTKLKKNNGELISAVVANKDGEIFDLEGYAAVGMSDARLTPLTVADTETMPYGSELMLLPDRKPFLYNLASQCFETLHENPYAHGEPIFPVAAFNSPGYVVTHISAYSENRTAQSLPLFSYGAIGWHKNAFRSAVYLVDRERRQDLRLMKVEDVISGTKMMKKKLPTNNLRKHLEKCALEYGCPAGKNFFLGRYEAPLPASTSCNAACLGCLSLQQTDDIPTCQNRINFIPKPEEIAEIALEHIEKVDQSIVSFGQGCEGDPLMVGDVIEDAIHRIRSKTGSGTINMNTNGSRPDVLNRLFAAGLDSIRISLNSVRKECYEAYFRPRGYCFADVVKSIDTALSKGKFVAINYLNCPGFTDTPQECDAFISFLKQHTVHLIQWRNLNFDPVKYWKVMNRAAHHDRPTGMRNTLKKIKGIFPGLKYGYFNPPKEKWQNS